MVVSQIALPRLNFYRYYLSKNYKKKEGAVEAPSQITISLMELAATILPLKLIASPRFRNLHHS